MQDLKTSSPVRKNQDYFPGKGRQSASFGWLPISLILLLGTWLLCHQLGEKAMVMEELASVNYAQAIPAKLTNFSPVYYFTLHLWMQLGTGDVPWLRGLSVLFALGSIYSMYLLGSFVTGKRGGLIAALLLAVSPLFINFSQMVLGYSMATCLAIAGSLALVKSLESPTQRNMAWWAITRLLMVLSLPIYGILLIPDGLLLQWRFSGQRRELWKTGKWLLLVIIMWLPFLFSLIATNLPLLLETFTNSAQTNTSIGGREVLKSLTQLTAFPFQATSNILRSFYWVYTWILAVILVFSLGRKHASPYLLWISIWLFVPAAMLLVLSQSAWKANYLLCLLPYLLILLASGFLRAWHTSPILTIIFALVYVAAVSGGLGHYYTAFEYYDPGTASISLNFTPQVFFHHGSASTYWLMVSSNFLPSEVAHWFIQPSVILQGH